MDCLQQRPPSKHLMWEQRRTLSCGPRLALTAWGQTFRWGCALCRWGGRVRVMLANRWLQRPGAHCPMAPKLVNVVCILRQVGAIIVKGLKTRVSMR